MAVTTRRRALPKKNGVAQTGKGRGPKNFPGSAPGYKVIGFSELYFSSVLGSRLS